MIYLLQSKKEVKYMGALSDTRRLMQESIVDNFSGYSEAELCKEYQKTQNPSIFATFALSVYEYVLKTYNKYRLKYSGEDEVSSCWLLCTQVALNRFDVSMGYKWSTYFITVFTRKYKNVLSYESRHYPTQLILSPDVVDHNGEKTTDMTNTLSMFEMLPSIQAEIDYKNIEIQMCMDSAKFSNKQRDIINRIIGGQTQIEIARDLGLTKQAINQRIPREKVFRELYLD